MSRFLSSGTPEFTPRGGSIREAGYLDLQEKA